MRTRRILGQRSWELRSDKVVAQVTRTGGQMGPVTFQLGGRELSPYSTAPWATEKPAVGVPPMLQVLRGDFFCAPFGGNEKPWRNEAHPPHGETSNADWSFRSLKKDGAGSTLHLSLETTCRKGTVDKLLSVRNGETVIYSSHVLSGMKGPMCIGSHPMLKFPGEQNSGLVSTSRILFGQVAPLPFELPAQGGYQYLKTGARFKRLDRVPAACGGSADLTLYPARKGFEDLVMLVHEAAPDFAWCAVVFPKEGYLWFSLKDPRVLRSTILWHSNGGRHYSPWSGRHTGVLGIEDVTAYFHYGLAESARPNPVNRAGFPTVLNLLPTKPLAIHTIQGVAAIPRGFGRVDSITPDQHGVLIHSAGKRPIHCKCNTGFLHQLSQTYETL